MNVQYVCECGCVRGGSWHLHVSYKYIYKKKQSTRKGSFLHTLQNQHNPARELHSIGLESNTTVVLSVWMSGLQLIQTHGPLSLYPQGREREKKREIHKYQSAEGSLLSSCQETCGAFVTSRPGQSSRSKKATNQKAKEPETQLSPLATVRIILRMRLTITVFFLWHWWWTIILCSFLFLFSEMWKKNPVNIFPSLVTLYQTFQIPWAQQNAKWKNVAQFCWSVWVI